MKLKGNQWWYVIGAVVIIGIALYYSGVFNKTTPDTKAEGGKGKVVPLPAASQTETSAN